MRVLLQDTDPVRAETVRACLGRVGISVDVLPATGIAAATTGLMAGAASVVPILIGRSDIRTAVSLVRTIRAGAPDCPLVVLHDGAAPGEIAELLDAGADDALGPPHDGLELAASLRAVTRRPFSHRSSEVRTGGLVVHLDGRHPAIDGVEVPLPARENEILRILALNLGKVVRRDALFDALYTLSDYQPHAKAIDVHICKLRKKIDGASRRPESWITTYSGAGYALCSEPAAHRS